MSNLEPDGMWSLFLFNYSRIQQIRDIGNSATVCYTITTQVNIFGWHEMV